MHKKAVVDIDNTLWHFCDVLYEQLRVKNPAVPLPENWVNWDFWMHYFSEEDFLAAITQMHLNIEIGENCSSINFPSFGKGDVPHISPAKYALREGERNALKY